MALYTIGDLHLSMGSDKQMDVFGGGWEKYMEKLSVNLGTLTADDTCVLCGDISWGMSLEESRNDFEFIDSLPGRKIIIKGNHDYWWSTASKMDDFFRKNGMKSVEILHNNCLFYDNTALCGTRGWFFDQDTGTSHDEKVMKREIMRLETSLKAAGNAVKLVFLHYPPRYRNYVCNEIIELLAAYDVKNCFYGHLHGPGHRYAVQGTISGVNYQLVSADYLNFKPLKILD